MSNSFVKLEEDSGILTASESVVESTYQNSLRPSGLDDFLGQERVCSSLKIAISAAKKRGEQIDHILLYGPPGLGKTSLAAVIASEMGGNFLSTSGPALERPGDLAAILSGLSVGDFLFIDEIHRLPRVAEEILYPAMEDFQVDIVVGSGASARSVKLEVPAFTLVAATTRSGMLSAPLRDRFGLIERLEFYSFDELSQIVVRSAGLLDIQIDQSGAYEIAKRARFTPRVANRLLKRCRDYAQHIDAESIDREVAIQALGLLEVDEKGFGRMDKLLLTTVIEKFDGGPVGLDTLSAAINEDRSTIEDVYEPFLIHQGYIKKTPRGREATSLAKEYVNEKG